MYSNLKILVMSREGDEGSLLAKENARLVCNVLLFDKENVPFTCCHS